MIGLELWALDRLELSLSFCWRSRRISYGSKAGRDASFPRVMTSHGSKVECKSAVLLNGVGPKGPVGECEAYPDESLRWLRGEKEKATTAG